MGRLADDLPCQRIPVDVRVVVEQGAVPGPDEVGGRRRDGVDEVLGDRVGAAVWTGRLAGGSWVVDGDRRAVDIDGHDSVIGRGPVLDRVAERVGPVKARVGLVGHALLVPGDDDRAMGRVRRGRDVVAGPRSLSSTVMVVAGAFTGTETWSSTAVGPAASAVAGSRPMSRTAPRTAASREDMPRSAGDIQHLGGSILAAGSRHGEDHRVGTRVREGMGWIGGG